MSRIKSADTKAELILRSALWKKNVRFRIHSKKIFGKPDILIDKYQLVVFVDGRFWHGYNWELNKGKIKSNRLYWIPKIEKNMRRDKDVNLELSRLGYTVMRFWDHEIFINLEKCINQILLYIESAKAGRIPEKG